MISPQMLAFSVTDSSVLILPVEHAFFLPADTCNTIREKLRLSSLCYQRRPKHQDTSNAQHRKSGLVAMSLDRWSSLDHLGRVISVIAKFIPLEAFRCGCVSTRWKRRWSSEDVFPHCFSLDLSQEYTICSVIVTRRFIWFTES